MSHDSKHKKQKQHQTRTHHHNFDQGKNLPAMTTDSAFNLVVAPPAQSVDGLP
jgi:hypothetical protein